MKHFFFFLFSFSLLMPDGFGRPPKVSKTRIGEWIEPVKPRNIYNTWVWLETDCCGVRHGVSSPASTSDNIVLQLNPDNTFLETHTKVTILPRSGTFNIRREVTNDIIQFNDERPARYFLSEKGDTLIISWKHLELQTEKYIKKK